MKDPFIIFIFKLLRHIISSKDFFSALTSYFSSFFVEGDFSIFLRGVSYFSFLKLSEVLPPSPFFPFFSSFYSLAKLQ